MKLPPIPAVSKESKKVVPPVLEDVLNKKESTDLKPRLIEALKVAFKYMDKGIGFTTKEETARKVFIWQSIDPEEIEVLATGLLELGMKSKVISTAVRQITRNYMRLQMGLILAPRFALTVQHYLHNGFGFPFAKKEK